jgi:hypothetical protein
VPLGLVLNEMFSPYKKQNGPVFAARQKHIRGGSYE